MRLPHALPSPHLRALRYRLLSLVEGAGEASRRVRRIAILRAMPASQRTHGDEGTSAPPVRWRVVEIAPDSQSARLAPYVPLDALARLLDATFGSGAWANRFTPFGTEAVVAELSIEGLPKSAVVRSVAGAGHPDEWAAAALNAAAALHGLELPIDPAADAWVDWDDEAREPLWWPEGATAGGPGMGRPSDDVREPSDGAPSPPTSAVPEAAAPDTATPDTATPEPAASGSAPIRSEGQRAIDKLMDRLREAGRGLEAAKLVNEHRGYGSDPDEARALYARLRQLLLEGATS